MHALVDFFVNPATQVCTVTLVSSVVQVSAFVSDPVLLETALVQVMQALVPDLAAYPVAHAVTLTLVSDKALQAVADA